MGENRIGMREGFENVLLAKRTASDEHDRIMASGHYNQFCIVNADAILATLRAAEAPSAPDPRDEALAKAREALEALDPRAIDALTYHQRQLDMDGAEVGVSRQALDETLATLGEVRSALAAIDAIIGSKP
jgi:hypothetical protein